MQHPAFPKVDNSRQMAGLALALKAARPLAGYAAQRVGTSPPPGPSRYQLALMGLLNLAVKQAEGVEWAVGAGNLPVAMVSLRVILEMAINADHLSNDHQYRERRSCQLLLENQERQLRLLAGRPGPSLASAAMLALGTKAINDARDELVRTIESLPKHPDDGDRWTSRKGVSGLSTRQRARLGGFESHYNFLYERGSGYAHGDGYAIANGVYFTPSDWENIPEQAGLLLMGFASDILDEFPELERADIVQAWNAYIASQAQA